MLIFPSPITAPIGDDLILFILSVSCLVMIVDYVTKFNANEQPVVDENFLYFSEALLLIVFFIGFLTSSVYSRFGYPILGVAGLPAVEYNEFGVPGLQGLVNACFLALVTIRYYLFLTNSRNFFNLLGIVLLFYPFLLLSRQLIFSAAVQVFALWWIFSNTSLRTKFKYLIVLFIVSIFLFGALGNMRTGGDVITSFLGDVGNEKFAVFYWFYIYVASPISNLALNFANAQPDGQMGTLLSTLLPTPARVALGMDKGFEGFDNIELVNSNLNMATFFAPGLLSFGLFGMSALALMLLAFIFFSKRGATRGGAAIFCLPVLVQISLFSAFTNLLLYLPVVFQIVIFFSLDFLRWVFSSKEGPQSQRSDGIV